MNCEPLAGTFVPRIMKMQVLGLQLIAGAVGPANLLLPHRCRNGVLNNAAHWNKLSTIGFEVSIRI